MTKEEYIRKYLIYVPSTLSPLDDTATRAIISKKGKHYVGLKGLSDVKRSIIDILAEYEICDLYTTSTEKGYSYNGVANYGFSEKNQTWYGWSHRAFRGFTIGSKINKEYSGYMPENRDAFEKMLFNFYKDPEYLDYKIENRTNDSFDLTWVYSNNIPNEKLRGTEGCIKCVYPEEYGKGEWEAKTLDDAKQMAMDFAESVA